MKLVLNIEKQHALIVLLAAAMVSATGVAMATSGGTYVYEYQETVDGHETPTCDCDTSDDPDCPDPYETDEYQGKVCYDQWEVGPDSLSDRYVLEDDDDNGNGDGASQGHRLSEIDINDHLDMNSKDIENARYIYADAFYYSSDEKLKEEIEGLEGSLEKISEIEGVSFEWKEGSGSREIGFVAQDVEKVYPELVTEGDDGLKSIDYGRMTAVLVDALNEQQDQIEEQERRVDELEKRVEELEEFD